MDYENLLEKAYKEIKQINTSGERFEIPRIKGHYEGKKTILTNFSQICSHIRREQSHFLKFLLKELASSGQIEGDRIVLNNKIPSTKINDKIELYTKKFVICQECQKPDTEIRREDRISFLHCLACGAKHPIPSI